MKKINLPQASMLTSPNPVSLVCTSYGKNFLQWGDGTGQ